MVKKKIVAFSPCDNNNLVHFQKLEKSLRKFHSEEVLPLLRFDNQSGDPDFWYRATPIIASKLLEEYETVIKLDSDQIILGSLDDLINDTEKYDVGVVLNDPTYPIQVWDITHPRYFNNGLVVLKSKEFTYHWLKLCISPHFTNYQFREQDFLTLLCSDYHNYTVKIFDTLAKVYGEVIKPQWTQAEMKDGKVMVGQTQICVYHSGGGNTPDKMNYKIRFQPEVVKYIDGLIK